MKQVDPNGDSSSVGFFGHRVGSTSRVAVRRTRLLASTVTDPSRMPTSSEPNHGDITVIRGTIECVESPSTTLASVDGVHTRAPYAAFTDGGATSS